MNRFSSGKPYICGCRPSMAQTTDENERGAQRIINGTEGREKVPAITEGPKGKVGASPGGMPTRERQPRRPPGSTPRVKSTRCRYYCRGGGKGNWTPTGSSAATRS